MAYELERRTGGITGERAKESATGSIVPGGGGRSVGQGHGSGSGEPRRCDDSGHPLATGVWQSVAVARPNEVRPPNAALVARVT